MFNCATRNIEKYLDKPTAVASGNQTYIILLSFLYHKRKEVEKMVTTIRLPDELHQKLKKRAEKRGMTFNGYLLEILWRKADEKEE